MIERITADFGGRPLTLETGRIARQANGAVWLEYGDSRVLVTAVCDEREVGADRDDDFVPLTVDYQEKMFSVGRFPGGYIKREGRPQLRETLTSRLIDRPIRPLLAKGWRHETQIVATVTCADLENETDIMGVIGASAALMISDMPFNGPVAGLRVGLIDGQLVCNPSVAQMAGSKMDLFVVSSKSAIVMVEGEADEISEEIVIEALLKAHEWAQPVIELQEQLAARVGKAKRPHTPPVVDEELKARISELALPGLSKAYEIKEKIARYAAIRDLKNLVKETLKDVPEEKIPRIPNVFDKIKHDFVRSLYLDQGKRIGNRAVDQVRDITIETSILPRVHGSALFTRGETQALVAATLGTKEDAQRLDDIHGDRVKKFIMHYNFPPYSVNEVKRMGSPGRRELGHGNLAERALSRLVPVDSEEFPYIVRLVSEILESNGSSSMATVCGGCLALMDAGVPIRKPVAGVAMGLMKENDKIVILTDILGDEDHLGDMDFKVCGTLDGITAVQMDLKMEGITRDLLVRALDQAKQGRIHILGKMTEHLPAPRSEFSPYAPRIVKIHIKTDRIRDVIGSGGKTIREIVEQTSCQINVEDDGTITIASPSLEKCDLAVEIIRGLTEEPEIGKIYKGKVTRLTDFGAFVEIIPGIEGLLHISEVAYRRIPAMEEVMAVGDIIEVKLLDMERNGKMRLSMKALLPAPEKSESDDSEGGNSYHGGGRREGGRDGRPHGNGPRRR